MRFATILSPQPQIVRKMSAGNQVVSKILLVAYICVFESNKFIVI